MKESLIEQLVYYRKQNGLTQNDVAEYLGVTYQAVSKWERGENLPDIYTLQKLSQLYKISIDEFLSNDVVSTATKPTPSVLHNIVLTIALFLLFISPLPYLTRNVTEAEGSLLGSILSFAVGSGILLFFYIQSKQSR